MLTQLSVRRYAHHHALLIVFLSSAIWGVLWVPMRYAESFGISGLWVVTLFHLLPAIAILPFIARAYIADRQHRMVSFIAGGLMGIGFVLYGLGLVVASVTKTNNSDRRCVAGHHRLPKQNLVWSGYQESPACRVKKCCLPQCKPGVIFCNVCLKTYQQR